MAWRVCGCCWGGLGGVEDDLGAGPWRGDRGRRTWDSLLQQYRPLPGRENWVLTHDPKWRADGAHIITNLQKLAGHDAWIGGGAQVYAQALAIADECWITDIDAQFPGDTHAPIPGPDWHPQPDHPEASDWQQSASAPVRYRYRVLTRHPQNH